MMVTDALKKAGSGERKNGVHGGDMAEVTLSNFAALRWRLILTDDAEEKAGLEKLLEETQAEAVNDYIETSCWSEDVPHLIGNKGTPAERLQALRAAYIQNKGAP